jgi:large subunit ribosomal protein L15
MQLNTIKPAEGSKKNRRRVGRGMGSGLGKTGGRGHNGQKSRSGASRKIGFEGGQMPLHRRLPKRGFTSLMRDFRAEITVGTLAKLGLTEVDLLALKAARAIANDAKMVKVIGGGEISVAVTLNGVAATASARKAILAAGGNVIDAPEVPKGKLKAKTPAATK